MIAPPNSNPFSIVNCKQVVLCNDIGGRLKAKLHITHNHINTDILYVIAKRFAIN
jgi:hypothetical protein